MTLSQNLDYTDKDFASIRARMFDMIPQLFPDWTDQQLADFGTMFVELFAFAFDVLCFYQDNQAKESRWSDATLRRSVLSLAKMLNYVPEGNAAASANLLVTLDLVPTRAVTLEAGRLYETAEVTNRLRFQQLFEVIIPAGLDPPQVYVTVEHSSNHEETLSSNSLPDQEFWLSGVPYLDNTLVVSALNGAYSQVDNFLSSTATSRHYVVLVDENGRALIRFGNGVNGEVPRGAISTFYKTGGGSAGNVDANTIQRIVGALFDVNGSRVTATVTNPASATGGYDRESIASIKQKGPPSTKVTDRTVGRDDYQLGAENVPGVARALMITSNEVEGVPENRGFLYIVPDGGGSPSEELREAVHEAVTETRPNTITFRVSVEKTVYRTVNVAATVYFESGANKRATVSAINQALVEYFQLTNADGTKNDNVKFGVEYGSDAQLPLSDLFAVVKGVANVRKIGASDLSFLLNNSHDDVLLEFYEFPVLGTVTITDGETGLVVDPL